MRRISAMAAGLAGISPWPSSMKRSLATPPPRGLWGGGGVGAIRGGGGRMGGPPAVPLVEKPLATTPADPGACQGHDAVAGRLEVVLLLETDDVVEGHRRRSRQVVEGHQQ